MRQSLALLFGSVILVGLSEPAAAINVVEVDSIDGTGTGVTALHSMSGLSGVSVHLASYHCIGGTPCKPDGGEGLLVKHGTGCSVSTEDGGSFFADAATNCWYRQNLNGDLRQWGLTQGSSYDVIANLSAANLISNATPRIATAFTALSNIGITVLHTRQVSLEVGTTLTIPKGSALLCDSMPQSDVANAVYTNLPGSLVIAHGAYIDATAPNVELGQCSAVIPEWYINQFAQTWTGAKSVAQPPFTTYPALEAVRNNMITAADTFVWAGTATKIHDINLYGADTCIYLSNGQRFLGQNIRTDCNYGLYTKNGGGLTSVLNFFSNNALTMQPGGTVSTEEYFKINNVQASPTNNNAAGSAVCQITVQAVEDPNNPGNPLFDTIDIQDSVLNGAGSFIGYPVYYPGWAVGIGKKSDVGGQSCNTASTGPHGNDPASIIKITGTSGSGLAKTVTIDLLGSDYGWHTSTGNGQFVTTSALWDGQPSSVIHIVGSMANIIVGMTASSSDGSWPTGTTTVVGVVPRCTGPDPNDGYNGCVILSSAPTGHNTGGSVPVTVTFKNTGDFSAGSDNTCDSTGAGRCFFLNSGARYIGGASFGGLASMRLPASRGAPLTASFLLDGTAGATGDNTFSYSHYYNIAAIDSNSCSFFQEGGDDNGELNPSNVFLYDAGSSRGCIFNGRKNGQSGASIVLDTYGTMDDASSLHQTSVNVTSLGQYGTGTITVSSTNGWPTPGSMHICKNTVTVGGVLTCDTSVPGRDEFVFYTCVTTDCSMGTQFSINVRSRLGTAPVDWNALGGTVTIFNTAVNGGSNKHPNRSAVTVFANLSNPSNSGTGNQLEVHHGAAAFTNVNTTGGGVGFISTNTSGVSMVAVNQNSTSLYFEGPNAEQLTSIDSGSTFANYVPHDLSTPLIYTNSGPDLPQVLTDTGGGVLATTYGTGTISIQSVANWPASGVALIDSEYVSYSNTGNATNLTIERRGMCGTVPALHAQFAVVLNAEAVLGCSPSSSPFFALRNDGAIAGSQSLLAHGQVYMSFDGTQYIKLCAQNGGGLIVNGVLRQISAKCATRDVSLMTFSALNYVYADYHLIGVTATSSGATGGKLRLTVTGSAGFGSTNPLSCSLIDTTKGTVTNIVDDNVTSLVNSTTIDVTDVTGFSGSVGECDYAALNFSPTSYVNGANGVKVKSGDATQTLVGMAYVGSSALSDTATKRDVASWFNRKTKTCITSLSGDQTNTPGDTNWHEVASSLECEFVTWGQDDLTWSIAGSGLDASGGSILSTSAGFDSTTAPSTEFAEANGTVRSNIATVGSKSALTENKHYVTMLYKVTAATAVYKSGSSIEVRINQ